MTLHLDFVDHTETPFTEGVVSDVVEQTLAQSRYGDILGDKTITLSVAFVSPEEIKRVNKEFREKDAITDVISIGEYSDEKDFGSESAEEIDLGELILCWEYIEKSAILQAVTPKYEFAYILSHGILHLLGYKHGKVMFDLQKGQASAFTA